MLITFFLFLVVSLIIFSIRFLILRENNVHVKIFAEALKNENNGHFEEAILTYETALNEFKKARFRNSSLKNTITKRLKVLHTITEYNKNLHFTRYSSKRDADW
ncbi:MAG: hypothetical protein JJE22_16980 [Bacteroidia bacterium]|nr:hypothetical protein [Bacteroidia bacterium]